MATKTKCFRTRKDGYATRTEADLARARIVYGEEVHHRGRADRDIPNASYPCGFCHQWHLRSEGPNEGRNEVVDDTPPF